MNGKKPCRCFGTRAVALALALASSVICQAQEIPGYPRNVDAFDRREVALLPGYCKHTQLFRGAIPGGNDQAAVAAWAEQMGPIFNDMHHYCFGLMKTNRAVILSHDPIHRKFYLADAVSEFDYVITRAPENFILLPEILTKKAENLLLLGRGPLAVFNFERAIELKIDYWPPYAYLSDYYKGSGDTKKARELLEAGLSHVPDAKGLKRRLAELNSALGRGGQH